MEEDCDPQQAGVAARARVEVDLGLAPQPDGSDDDRVRRRKLEYLEVGSAGRGNRWPGG